MGLSSSQARLLHLTTRMHQIEYKAAKVEAEKLQMANESRRVYEDYLFALEKTNVQVGMLSVDGSNTYINTTLKMLEGNTDYKIAKTLYLKDAESDKVYVSPAMADKYNLDDTGVVADLNTFMANAGFIATVPGYAMIPNQLGTTSYSPVATDVEIGVKRTVPNIDPSAGFQAVAPKSTAGATPISTVSDFTVGQTYVISSAADLVKLQDLTNAGKTTAGVNFVLGANIDMSGINWTGIGSTTANAFKGTFDGNGYTISNLTSTNSGLFKNVVGNQTSTTSTTTGVTTTATQGVIKNVCLTGLNVTNTSVGTKGGIIGYAKNAYVENCYTEGSIQGYNWTAGMIGQNEGSAIANSTANVNITATSCCVGGFLGHDTNGILSNCVSMGNVTTSSYYVGGLIGHETPQGGVNGSSFIYKCSTISNVNGSSGKGAFIGQIDGSCAATVIGSQYSSANGLNAVGAGGNKLTSDGSGAELTGDATREVTTNKVNVPSQNAIKANIALMLEKSGTEVDPSFAGKLNTWLNKFYQADPNFTDGSLVKDSLKLASINDAITAYLQNGSNAAVVNALVNDVMNNSLTSTAAYQNNYVETKNYEYSPFASTSADMPSKNTPITAPSLLNVSNNLYTVLHNNGYANADSPADVNNVLAWVTNNYPNNAAGNLALANLNAYLNDIASGVNKDMTELNKIHAAIQNGSTYTMPAAAQSYPANEYSVAAMVAQPQSSELAWNMNDPEIAAAVNYYEVIKNGYIIVTEEQANSNEWLTNMINSGSTVLVGVEKQQAYETSVSTNTSLQEVTDETLLRKAEAKYEADMLKIDRKDRKYDIDLANLDNERNAIKQEIETLKTIAKENVERTFKLFS